MTLLNANDLGVSPEALRTAEAIVAAHLGATSLSERPCAQAGFTAGNVIALHDGPLTGLTEFSLNGVPALPHAAPWYLRLSLGAYPDGLASYAPAGGAYAITYTAGWTADTLPEAVREAVRQVALGAGDPGPVSMERLGDVETRYAVTPAPDALPPAVASLLAPYRLLRF